MRITDLLSASSIDLNAKPLNEKRGDRAGCEAYGGQWQYYRY